MRVNRAWLLVGLVVTCVGCSQLPGQGTRPTSDRRVLRVAYFVPTDRQALSDRVERLDRVMGEVQGFYRRGMRDNGFGPLTFGLEHDPAGRLCVHVVKAQGPMNAYGRDDAEKVREEVKKALAVEGIDMDRETVVVFQLLLAWRGNEAAEVGPYVGGGDLNGGTAWVYDDPLLDPRLLDSTKPGGYYGGPCSIGEFNSHYIGGIAHELGHALGLPHDKEREADGKKRGQSLMGGGNHTYGRDQRGEGPGTFLTSASAIRLAGHPLFTGRPAPGDTPPSCRIIKFEPLLKDGKLTLIGRIQPNPSKTFGLIVYNDQQSVPDDYDAVGYTCKLSSKGDFRVEIDEFHPGAHQMRWCICYQDGRTSQFEFNYTVDKDGRPDIQALAGAVAAKVE